MPFCPRQITGKKRSNPLAPRAETLVNYLLKNGADATAVAENGDTALLLAEREASTTPHIAPRMKDIALEIKHAIMVASVARRAEHHTVTASATPEIAPIAPVGPEKPEVNIVNISVPTAVQPINAATAPRLPSAPVPVASQPNTVDVGVTAPVPPPAAHTDAAVPAVASATVLASKSQPLPTAPSPAATASDSSAATKGTLIQRSPPASGAPVAAAHKSQPVLAQQPAPQAPSTQSASSVSIARPPVQSVSVTAQVQKTSSRHKREDDINALPSADLPAGVLFPIATTAGPSYTNVPLAPPDNSALSLPFSTSANRHHDKNKHKKQPQPSPASSGSATAAAPVTNPPTSPAQPVNSGH